MKKIVGMLILAIGISAASYAQNGQGMAQEKPEVRAQKMTDRLTSALSLTEDQQKKVYEINMKTAEKMESLRQSKDFQSMRAAQEDRDTQLKAVLTPDQEKKYEDLKAQMQQQRGQRLQQPSGAAVAPN